MTEEDLSLRVPRWVWPLGVIAQLLTALAAGYVYLGPVLTAAPVVAGFLALVLWLATSYRDPRRRRVLPLYLLVLIVLLLQGLEQWLLGYASTLQQLMPRYAHGEVPLTERIQLTVFTLAAVSLYLYGALGLFFHHPLGNFMAWFVMVYAVLGGLSLFAMSLASGQFHYIPGLAAAVVAIPLGTYGGFRLAQPH